jgi:hypothetical protein
MKAIHMLDRRWSEIEPGAPADCGQIILGGKQAQRLTTDITRVTCKSCARAYRGWGHLGRPLEYDGRKWVPADSGGSG